MPTSPLQFPDLTGLSEEVIENEIQRLKIRAKTCLYSGATGAQVPGRHFVGILPFQRILKPAEGHFGTLKVSSNPRRDPITNMPTKNRELEGGVCDGYMDGKTYLLHNATGLQRHRSEVSDQRLVFVCSECELFASTRHCLACSARGVQDTAPQMVSLLTNQWAVNQQLKRRLGGGRYGIRPDLVPGPVPCVPIHLRERPRAAAHPQASRKRPREVA
jgi:hypothetical protein